MNNHNQELLDHYDLYGHLAEAQAHLMAVRATSHDLLDDWDALDRAIESAIRKLVDAYPDLGGR